jgi:hypothetical protein
MGAAGELPVNVGELAESKATAGGNPALRFAPSTRQVTVGELAENRALPGAPSLRVLGARVGIHEYSVR